MLVDELERELRQDYPPHYIHELDVHSFEASQGIFLVCIDNNEPIGCLGLRPLGRETGELKRMYVRPNFRGRGAAKADANGDGKRGCPAGLQTHRPGNR